MDQLFLLFSICFVFELLLCLFISLTLDLFYLKRSSPSLSLFISFLLQSLLSAVILGVGQGVNNHQHPLLIYILKKYIPKWNHFGIDLLNLLTLLFFFLFFSFRFDWSSRSNVQNIIYLQAEKWFFHLKHKSFPIIIKGNLHATNKNRQTKSDHQP